MQRKKLLLIGWDAADWQIIDPLMAQGKMPALSALLARGCRGNLATLNPPLSPMLWTSIATGKRAYDHGVLGFVEVDKASQSVRAVSQRSRKMKAIWNILNEAGLKTNLINWWPSFPPEKIQGVCVSNNFHQEAPPYDQPWPMHPSMVYPGHLHEAISPLRLHPAELQLSHILPFIPAAASLDVENDPVLKPLMRVLARCSSVHNVSTYLMQETEWDVTFIYQEALDHFSHLAMKYHPPRQAGVSEDKYELYKGIIEAAYRFHDMMLGRLIDLAGEDCHIMLISDHGFQSAQQRVAQLPDLPAAPAIEHRKYGVLATAGPEFARGQSVYGASLLDITPAILQLFDLPVGEDMEGKVPLQLFAENPAISHIPSWEDSGPRPALIEGVAENSAEVLQQLEELGYISLSGNNKVRYAEYELQYNLCQSLCDGGKWTRAETEAHALYTKFRDGRSALLLAEIYLQNYQWEKAAAHLQELQAEHPGHPQLQFLEARYLMGIGQDQEALKLLTQLEEKGVQSVQLWLHTARMMLSSGHHKAAENYISKCLSLDSENASALTLLAQLKVEKGEWEEAISAIEDSLRLLFYQPHAHYLMAFATWQLKHRDTAEKALAICLQQAPKHMQAQRLREKIYGKSEKRETVFIVSGLPRSGTSMMMQMLDAGGMSVLSDQKREGDEHNPRGYYEYEKVKELGREAGWLKEARGKVLKVVSPLLRYLPPTENYLVIRMKRPMVEVIISQQKMRGQSRADIMQNFPFQLAVNLEKEENKLNAWLSAQPNIKVLEIEYHQCLENPEDCMQNISHFCGISLDPAAARQVAKDLHRNKLW